MKPTRHYDEIDARCEYVHAGSVVLAASNENALPTCCFRALSTASWRQ